MIPLIVGPTPVNERKRGPVFGIPTSYSFIVIGTYIDDCHFLASYKYDLTRPLVIDISLAHSDN